MFSSMNQYQVNLSENDNGRFIDDIFFKGDQLTSEHKLGVVLNAFYINCTPFSIFK